ncbi:Zinc finger BED domain-containing protein 5-like [Oopsacas minuta]|uniref:Zinc finger BED domain-containing protein 5-like n=1 Tax=Oopsacas minuta TaxID=111878 RepID=A0AAV7JE99_9METZ|nr:Zinc finger BED domain-containing protein 5-like [Oopsacas minuta]
MAGVSRERPYHDKFIELGFFYVTDRGVQKPQCVICYEVLSNESMKHNKLQRHLSSKHSAYKDRDRSFFDRKLTALRNTRLDKQGKCQQINENALEASYRVSLRIAKAKSPHTIGVELIMPCAKEMVSLMIGEDMVSKLGIIPLSNNTVHRRICDMSEDTTAQNIAAIKESLWHAMQLDESTDIASCAQLIVWVRFIKDGDFVDEPLLCKSLETKTKGEDIFTKIDAFYNKEGLDFNKLIGSTTDGAPPMLGKHSGFKAKLQQVAPHTFMIHCMIHREALAARTMPESLMNVFSQVIKIVNHIKLSALNTRLFKLFCDEMDADHMSLLFYTQVRWLSRGNVILRVYELRQELKEFLRTQMKNEWVAMLESSNWLAKLCYLSDIFERINVLNRTLQGKDTNLMLFHDKIKGFLATLGLLKDKVSRSRFVLFPRLSVHMEESENIEIEPLSYEITEHIQSLISQFENYFPKLDVQSFTVARDPFSAPLDAITDDDITEEELVRLKQDSGAKALFQSASLHSFWCKMLQSYPRLSEKVMWLLMPYPSTYLCEQSFSTMVVMKTKHRNRLEIEKDMIVALSSTKPRIGKLVAEKQAQPSH